MGRKKRAVTANTRKTRSSAKNVEIVQEESVNSEDDNSSESKSSNVTESSNNDKQGSSTVIQHKKFGKFRCLVEENSKIDSENEDNKSPDNCDEDLIEGLKDVDLGQTTKEMIENIIGNVTVSKIEIIKPEIEEVQEEEKMEIVKEEEVETKVEDEKKEDKTPQSDEKQEKVEEKLDDSLESTKIRRSSRIKSISVLKQKSRGRGVVKIEAKEVKKIENDSLDSETSNASTSSTFVAPILSTITDPKPVKVKSRWRRSSELEMNSSPVVTPLVSPQLGPTEELNEESLEKQQNDLEIEEKLRHYLTITENEYLTERISCREAKRMLCDCFLVEEEIERGEFGCGEDCLNRLLMIECNNLCVVGDRCTNKRFQKCQYAPCEVFKTKKKGFGIKATANIPAGEFILEYVGEVLDQDEFDTRASEYSKDKNRHYYFMALRSDAVIDATQKGNISRFINHSCEPNAETQKWTVNGELRIGFFSTRNINAGDEITFDYQFQRYGKEAQRCFCEAPTCRGWIGEEPDSEEEEEEESENELEEELHEEPKDELPIEKIDDVKIEDEKALPVKKEPIRKSKERREIRKKRQQRKDIFEDLDLDDAIEMLSQTGVKNQTHTLTLSRLMVRAKEIKPRMRLLGLLTNGEEPCRRLFLDYHGLRLIHGWMIDLPDLKEINMFKIEILKTLDSLPIKNKTILQDSKVLSIVEKWASKGDVSSPTDSENSPKDNQDGSVTKMATNLLTSTEKSDNKTDNDHQIATSLIQETKMDVTEITTTKMDIIEMKMVEKEESVALEKDDKKETIKTEVLEETDDVDDKNKVTEDLKVEEMKKNDDKTKTEELETVKTEPVDLEKQDSPKTVDFEKRDSPKAVDIEKRDSPKTTDFEKRDSPKSEENSLEKQILELCSKLLERWLLLKENFRIPKKERIKQMKEHEREANRGYNAGPDENKNQNRYSSSRNSREIKPREKSKTHKEKSKIELRDYKARKNPSQQLTKQERRQLFAIQVMQEEEEMRRRKNQELIRQHEQRCLMMGQDPKMIPFDPNVPYWNHQPNWPPPNIINIPPNPIPNQFYPPIIPNQQFTPQLIEQPPIVVETPPTPIQLPPPVLLPPKWKCARDQYGRPYYYHVKIRISQWEPPEFKPEPVQTVEQISTIESSDSSSSSETSSLSSDSDSDSSDDDLDDTKLLLEIRNKLKAKETQNLNLEDTIESENIVKEEVVRVPLTPAQKRKRDGLVTEIIISPRSEEDKLSYRIEAKKYKDTKEKLKRQKELVIEQSKKKIKAHQSSKITKKHKLKSKPKAPASLDLNSEESKRIKENFRKAMATTIVQNLNAFRKPDCKIGRITNTEDFKHLARKLTHYVMSKELKHCQRIEDLTCNESVKVKSRDFIRKYMQKFGEVYSRPSDELDY